MLEFRIQDLKQEAEALLKLADGFLDVMGHEALRRLVDNLGNLLYTTNANAQVLEVPDEDGQRIRTVLGRGYEPGKRLGAHTVSGEMSFKWDVQIVNAPSAKNRTIRIPGNASTKLRIVEHRPEQSNRLMAQWQIEMGTHDSPGCFFHVGVSHIDPPPTLFRGTLSVPRLPCMLVTPTDALDYLLGELFQTTWMQRNQEELDAGSRWGKLQGRRLRSLLSWQLDNISEASGSAWNRYKHERTPPSTLFLG